MTFCKIIVNLGSADTDTRHIYVEMFIFAESIKDTLSCSLFLLGIGVNDYNHLLLQNRSLTAEIRPLVPKVVAKVENAIKVGFVKVKTVSTLMTLH